MYTTTESGYDVFFLFNNKSITTYTSIYSNSDDL